MVDELYRDRNKYIAAMSSSGQNNAIDTIISLIKELS